MSNLPLLYSFRRCPYAMRARMALYAAQIDHEHREVKLSAKPSELIAASPKATVPVLITSDGKAIDESLDIMFWALQQSDPLQWLPSLLSEDHQQLIEQNDGPFKFHLDRYKYPERHGVFAKEHQQAVAIILQSLNQRLCGQPFLAGVNPKLVDIALFPFIRQCAHVDKLWFMESFIELNNWLCYHAESELFQSIMRVFDPWQPTDEAIVIKLRGQNV